MKHRILCSVLILLILASFLSISAFAAGGTEAQNETAYWTDDFESYEAGAALPSGSVYTTPAGTVIDSGDSAHGQVLEGKTGSTLYLTVGKADKTIEFDYQFKSGSNFGGWGGLYVKAYYGGENVEIYNIFSPTLAGGAMRISGPGSEAGGLKQVSQTWENDTWYKAKLRLSGSTLSVKTWKADGQEPAGWNLEGTSTVVTPVDEGSQIQIIFDKSNAVAGAGTIWLDNLKITLPEEAQTYTIGVECDTQIGSVSGAGDYQTGESVTLGAAVNDAYLGKYEFSCWQRDGITISTENPYTFTPGASGIYTAVFRTVGAPQYTYFSDDFESYVPGPADKSTMPANYISFSELGEYRIAQEAGGADNQVFTGHTSSVSNSNLFYLDCEIIDKEICFDFRYDEAFAQWGGLFVKLHCQESATRPVGDQYYFSINPNFTAGQLIISCNEDNLKMGAYSFDSDTWYRVRSQLADGELRIRIWPRDQQEPTDWTLTQRISGFTPVAEGSWFGMEFWNHASGTDVNIELDNLVMKTWRQLPEKPSFTVTAAPNDAVLGSVSGGGSYLSGNFAKLTAQPKDNARFVCWQDASGAAVCEDPVYSFAVTQSVHLTAVFEKIPVVVRSFMAEGLTQAAQIDETTKTVRLRFASDVDLANVYPYIYLDAGVEIAENCYERMDLSSGQAAIGAGTDQWTIYAVQNAVMKTFYVSDTTGDDANDGLSADHAFKTLARAKQAIQEIDSWSGDVVVRIACGEYVLEDTLQFTTADSAEKGYAIIWQGTEDPNNVVISSGRRLDGQWKQSSDVPGLADGLTAWEYDAAGLPYSRDLYVNGDLAQLAIYVLDESAVGSWRLTYLPQMDRNSTGYLVKDELADMCQWRNPSDIEFVYEVGWTYSILPVTSIVRSGENSQVNMKEDAFWCALHKPGVNIEDPNFIQNCFEGLDSEGEWYFDRAAQKIYYITSGADPNDMEMVMPTLDQLITVDGQEDSGSGAQWVYGVTFKNLTFAYTAYLRPHTYGQVEAQASYIVNLDSKNWDYFHKHDYYLKTDGGITASYVEGMRVSGCIFTNMSGSGFDFEEGCVGCQFVGNNVTNMCGNGITVGGVAVRDAQPYNEYTYVNGVLTRAGADPDRVTQYILVMSNKFQGIGLRYTGSVGIFAGYVSDLTIAHNTISDASYSGISIGWGWGYWDGAEAGVRNDQTAYGPEEAYHVFETPSIQARYVVEGNDISSVCQRLADGGTVYALSNMPGSKLTGNYMHDSPVEFGGVYFDEATGGFTEIQDNILYRVHTNYFYHLVGGFTDRQEAMQALWNSGNYLGVSPEDSRADDNYRAIVAHAGVLPALAPAEISGAHTHVWGDWTEAREATCTQNGELRRTCGSCGDIQTKQTDKEAHTVEILPAVPATYTSTGLTEGKRCAVCGEILLEQQIIPRLTAGGEQNSGAGSTQQTEDPPVFTDVGKDDWFYDDVMYVCEKGLMNGTGSGRFAPNTVLTRGMVVTLLYRLEARPAVFTEGTFADVALTDWYGPAAEWAADEEIVNGYPSGNFGPNDAITREQLAAILYRYAVSKGYDVSAGEAANMDAYTDAAQVSPYAQSAMRWAVGEGLLAGTGSRLLPQANATRAQVAAILHRFCKLYIS